MTCKEAIEKDLCLGCMRLELETQLQKNANTLEKSLKQILAKE